MDTGVHMANQMDAEMERGTAMHDEIERLRAENGELYRNLNFAYQRARGLADLLEIPVHESPVVTGTILGLVRVELQRIQERHASDKWFRETLQRAETAEDSAKTLAAELEKVKAERDKWYEQGNEFKEAWRINLHRAEQAEKERDEYRAKWENERQMVSHLREMIDSVKAANLCNYNGKLAAEKERDEALGPIGPNLDRARLQERQRCAEIANSLDYITNSNVGTAKSIAAAIMEEPK